MKWASRILPNLEEIERFREELLEIAVDVTEYLPDAVQKIKEQMFVGLFHEEIQK